MKPIILFDVDNTLIDKEKFKLNFKKRISKVLNVPLEDFLKVEQGYVKKPDGFTDFIPLKYIRFISESYKSDESSISKAFFYENNFKNILYDDVISCLGSLRNRYDLGIFSQSFKEFQMLKLHKTGLLNYFNQDLIFIFNNKLTEESLKLLPNGCIVIDDNLPVICALEETKRFRPVWLNRKKAESTGNFVTAFNLVEFGKFLASTYSPTTNL